MFVFKLNQMQIFQLGKENIPFTSLYLSIPYVHLGALKTDNWEETYRVFGIAFPTMIQFARHSDGSFWDFKVSIFGFGFEISRQTGY